MDVQLPFHSELPENVCARARRALRREMKTTDNLADDTQADAIVEQVWNALVGHDKIKPKDR